MTEVTEPRRAATSPGSLPPYEIALADLLDRLLAAGVVVSGDIVLSIADVDLVYISVRALITSVRESDASNGSERVAERSTDGRTNGHRATS